MNDLQIFSNPEFGDIRTVELDGEPWLVGRDVATALGYSNTKDALLSHVDEEDKRILQRSEIATIENHIPKDVLSVNFVNAEVPNRGLTIINESGLYSLVLSSKLPGAKKFKRWITSEVLPAIRKHGGYSQRPMSPAEMFLQQAQINVDMERRMEQLERSNKAVEQKFNDAVTLFSVPTLSKDEWQTEINSAINRLCEGYGLSHQKTRGDMYSELEDIVGCNLTARQSRLRERMRRSGATYKEANAVTKLAVIAQDAKLRVAFEGIVRRWTAQKLA